MGRWVLQLYAVLSLHIVIWCSVVSVVFGVWGFVSFSMGSQESS